MAALDFPSSPTNGQTYTANGSTWTYNSATTSWLASSSALSTTLTVPEGGTGLTSLTAGYIPFGNGTSAFGSSANLTWNNSTNQLTVSGKLGLGAATSSAIQFYLGGTAQSGTDVYSVYTDQIVSAVTTGSASAVTSNLSTAATAFTLPALNHFVATQGTIGAGSTVTTQRGFYAHNTLTGATNNYGFYSDLASGTNRWNFYANGTAFNFFQGAVGMGNGPLAYTQLRIGGTGPSSSNLTYSVYLDQTAPATTTSEFASVYSIPNTAASAFTLGTLFHFIALQGTIGAGSAITNQFGFYVGNNLTGATNNYAFYSNIPSGTNRWNFYANGTAQNYFGGTTTLAVAPIFSSLTGIVKGNGASAATVATAGTDYMAPGTTSNLTVGHTLTPYNGGTPSAASTYTPAAANGNYQYLTNNAAFTLAAPSSDCAIDILVTNGASAGAITISGYTAPTGGGGDTYATTNTQKFLFMIRRINGTSTYSWKALQ